MAHLLVTSGADAGRRYDLLTPRCLIGRNADCDLQLDNPTVSRHHARITCLAGQYLLEDLSSRNGTRVNEQVIAQKQPLHDGDIIRICALSFSFHTAAVSSASPREETEAVVEAETPRYPDRPFLPAASWEKLELRASLLRRLRQFFDDRGFLEVETPLLSVDTVVDRYLDPLPVAMRSGPSQARRSETWWLQTSPEFAMKRLLAAGARAIYQVTRSFRAHETGPLHNLEFTIVEWYRAGDGLEQGMALLSEFCQHMLGTPPAELLSYREAFRRYAGVDPLAGSNEELEQLLVARGFDLARTWVRVDRDAWLNLLLCECVEPHLGQTAPTILYDYPASQAALARVREGDPPVAERYELYVRGVELANGYHELQDGQVLRQRNGQVNRQRLMDGKQRLPEDSTLLKAMEHGLPPCCGVALGFDRLVMIAAAAKSLAEVMAFPSDRA